MSEKRVPVISLCGALVLLSTLWGFAGSAPPKGPGGSGPPAATPAETAGAASTGGAADPGLVFEAVPRSRRLGAGLGEAPAGPGVFRFEVTVPVRKVTRAFLTYELSGLPSWTAAVRSINGLPPQGGFGGAPASGTALQVEEVNPRWLREGSNEVVFLPVAAGEPRPFGVARVEEGGAPAGEPIPYTVRHLRLVVTTEGRHPGEKGLHITHPVQGESEAEGAYLRGYVDSPSQAGGPVELFVDGSHVEGGVRPADGTFAVFAPRTGAVGEPWEVEVEVVYPDGTRLRRTVALKGDPAEGEEDEGGPGEKAEADTRAGEAKSLGLGGARLDVPAGAVGKRVRLTMRRLAAGELPELDSGMTNVTPLRGGLRMGPHGIRFKKPVHLTVPYDPALLPRGMTAEDVRTYFFDAAAGRWTVLPRAPEKASGAAVASLTDHFTDFINATLAVPDEPQGGNLSPNSLKEMAKADPAAGIVQIAPPEGGPTGDAVLDFPLVLPPGRHGLEPDLAVHYDSSSGDGWLGMGWDLPLPSLEVSTLFGVPRYDAGRESESYLLEGEQLAPLADPAQARLADRVYVRRAEGSFERIVRRGSAPAGYSWEVTDKDGVRHLYGLTPQARLADPATGNVFRWYLERTVDLHGNTVDYTYFTDSEGGGGEPWAAVYPASIAYTGVNGAGAFYEVRFTLDDGNQRPDRMSSGRPGFKTFVRRRLASVDVLAGGALVRRYLFQYQVGDFSKSLLRSVAVTGEDGLTPLYQHGFRYFQAPAGFGPPVPWGRIGDVDDSRNVTGGAHGFAGVGDTACVNHAGPQAGGGGGAEDTRAAFLDLDGDGLPDRVSEADGSVHYNRLDPVEGTGGFESPSPLSLPGSLGHNEQWSFDLGAGLHAFQEQVNVGANLAWHHSNDDATTADLNGDGLPDLVSSGSVLFNQGGTFGGANPLTPQGSGFVFANPEESAQVLGGFTLKDPLRKLVLPYDGTVTIAGAVQRKAPGGDGVEAEIHGDGGRLWRRTIAAEDAAPCVPAPGDGCGAGLTVAVQAGDALYFLAGSISGTEADALLWAPVVAYQSAVVPGEGAAVQDVSGRQDELEPYGARRFVFDAQADFRLAGFRGASWTSQAAEEVVIQSTLTKPVTAAEVTAAIERKAAGGTAWTPLAPPLTLGPAEVGSFDLSPAAPVAVAAGESIRFHLTSGAPLDPALVPWTSTVTLSTGFPLGVAAWTDLFPPLWSQPDETLSGGYHGWFYGEWSGDRPFSPAALRQEPAGDGTPPPYLAAQPNPQGLPGGGGPAGPVWQGSGFDLYLAAEGVKPSRQGRDVAADLARAEGKAATGLGLLRKTSGAAVNIEAGAGPAGVSLSCGASDTELDLLDLNGDGYPDQVKGDSSATTGLLSCVGLTGAGTGGEGQVRLGDGSGGFAGAAAMAGLEAPVRRAADATLGLSAGLSLHYPRKDGKGRPKAVASPLPSIGSSLSYSQTTTDLIDVNGDGLPDRVTLSPDSGAVRVRLNLGYRFGAEESWDLPPWSEGTASCLDIAHLGTDALAKVTSFGSFNALRHVSSSVVNAGVAFGPFGGGVGTSLARTLVDLVDVNGDGLADHVAKDQGGAFRVRLNLGSGWGEEQAWSDPDWPSGVDHHGGLFQCLDALDSSGDVNGNGSLGAPICIPLLIVGIQIEVSVQVGGSDGGSEISLADFDGDGLADRVLKGSDATVYVKLNQGGRANLLTAVDRPLGSTVSLEYRRQGNRADRSDPGHLIDMPSSQWVLAATVVADGRGQSYRTAYDYFDDAFYDRREREPYGYARVRATLPDGSTLDRSYLNQSLYSRHLPVREAVAGAGGSLFRVVTRAYTEVPLAATPQARFAAKVQESTLFYEGSAAAGKSTSRSWQYDELGNVVAMTDAGDDGPADDVVATVSYAANPTAWLFKPQLVEVRDGTGALLRRTTAAYDAAGEVVRQERTLSGGRNPQTGAPYSGAENAVWTYAYDEVGNLTTFTDPTGYGKTVTYDPQTRSYPARVADSFGYATTSTYEPKYGEPATLTDENGNTVRRAYDTFGRLLRVVGPDDTDAAPALAFEYHPGAPLSWSAVHQKDVARADPIDSVVFVDGLERVVETKEDAELDLGAGTATQVGMRVSGRIAFDANGRVASQGQPVFDSGPAGQYLEVEPKNPTTFSYDPLDRMREVRYPHGAVTRVDYGFGTLDGVPRLLTTRTDPTGRAARFYRDVRDNVRGVEQTNTVAGASRVLTTRYAYDALSQLLSVTDALGKSTLLEWDTLGRNVGLDNPDAGRTERRYDPAGNLGAEITANLAAAGQQIRYLYTFNRLDRVDYPVSPDVLYTWGAPGATANRANRIVTVTDESGKEERSYDKLGNVVLSVKTINSLNGASLKGPYTSRFQYDAFGRLLSVTSPVNEQITYGFDAGGRVKSVTGLLRRARYDYLRHLGYDEFGERVRLIFGNGAETRYTFDPRSRFLAQLRTTSLGRNLQNLSYQRDLTGTILGLQNDLAVSAVPSLWGGPTAQSFQYDDLNQLTGATATYRVALGKTSSYSFTQAYDEVGEIVAKRQLHQVAINDAVTTQAKTSYDWSYAYGGAQPHAPARIGDRSFRYDLNGNQTGWDSDGGSRRTITWDEENRPLSVADGSQTVRFLYDAAGMRSNKLGPNGETVYLNRWFSIRNAGTVSRHVFADDLRIATKMSTSAEFLYFYHPDHLGSAHFLTNEQGYPHEHAEYFPSGEIWVDEHTDTVNTPFLFSGKEIDGETGLSYFGARYYEPRQGQWLSVDPILDGMLDGPGAGGADLSARGFILPGNVYGYVANDPLNRIDPTGLLHEDLKSMAALAAFQAEHGGSSQGTLALIETAAGGFYMVEQQTNNRVKDAAEAKGITYLPQARRSGFHAEMRFIKDAEGQGVILAGAKIWVSKPICGDCADTLRAKGVRLETTSDDSRYRNWVHPDIGERTVPTSGRKYKGRRSELDQLQDNWMDRGKKRRKG